MEKIKKIINNKKNYIQKNKKKIGLATFGTFALTGLSFYIYERCFLKKLVMSSSFFGQSF